MLLSEAFASTIFQWLARFRFRATPTTIADGQLGEAACDSKGALHVRVVATGPESGALGAASYSNPAGAAYEFERVVKGSPGTLYALRGHNGSANDRWIQVFNSTTVPSNTAVPFESIKVLAGQNFSLDIPEGRAFATGIAVAVSTTGDELTKDASGLFFFVARYA